MPDTIVVNSGSRAAENRSRIAVLPSGDVLIDAYSIGTEQWIRVSQQGQIKTIEESLLPAGSTVRHIISDSNLLVLKESKGLMRADLANPAVSLTNGKTTILDQSGNGFVVGTQGRAAENVLITPDGKTFKTACMLPKKLARNLQDVDSLPTLSIDGHIIFSNSVLNTSNKDSGAILGNYCLNATYSFIGSCSKYFKKGEIVKSIPDNTKCQVEFKITDSRRKGIPNISVQTNQGSVYRGKTDSSGKMKFSFTTFGDYYLNTLVGYGDKKFYSQSVSIRLLNQ